jgi:hypothetical protein
MALLAEAQVIISRLTREKFALQRELQAARGDLEQYRDLRCDKCGHHAHPDEICGFCALAAAKIYSEDVTHPEGKPQFQQGGSQHEVQELVTAKDCQAYCDRIESLRRQLMEGTTWQPIETAPKSGDPRIMIAQFVGGELHDIDFDAVYEEDYESWEMPQLYGIWVSAFGRVEEPTHWALLPTYVTPTVCPKEPTLIINKPES